MARRGLKQTRLVEQQKLAKGRRPTGTDYLADMRQTDSASKRSRAIMAFGKTLRRADKFQETWDAVGGAEGVATLMASFSVRDVRSMCRWLGRTASAVNARPQRRAALGQLVKILDNGTYDVRPLRTYYQDIVPACTERVVQEVDEQPDVKWSLAQRKGLLMGHREQHEEKFLQEAFSPDARSFNFANETNVFIGNQAFSEQIISTLLASDSNKIRIPPDFMYVFAMPLLKRLGLRRHDEATRLRVVHNIIQCVVKHHDHLGSTLDTKSGGLLQYIAEKWHKAPETKKEQMEAYLVQLLRVFPSKPRPLTLHQIHQATYTLKLKRLTPDKRYHLIRLFIKHLPAYGFDIEDESPAGLSRLRELPIGGDKWPSKLFSTVDNASGFRLFERLAGVHPGADFMAPPRFENTVLRQTRALGEIDVGDADTLRALLRHQSLDQTDASAWLSEARELFEERKKKAVQSREPRERAFWAKSAFHLSVAAGNLNLLKEVIVWARRFRRDSLTTYELYQGDTLNTVEFTDLLCAVSGFETKDKAAEAVEVINIASISENIRLANMILVELTDSAILDVSEPSFQRSKWDHLLRLPKTVADRRLDRVQSFTYIAEATSTEDPDRWMKDAVWKPTIETLIEVEKHLREPGAAPLLPHRRNLEVTGASVLLKIPDLAPEVLAELAQFVISTTQARLGPENFKAQIDSVIDVILRVARSDQPSLACPFIRRVILHESENSSWHRRLVNQPFISSLPAATGREFLQTMADAMRDAMKAQNSSAKSQAPVIKVSTIKMFAQILQGNHFLAPIEACDMLTSLLSETHHIDSRLAIIAALMSILAEPKAPLELRQRVLDSFEAHAVPTMGQLSERRGVTEAEWEDVSKDATIPMPDVGADAPLLEMLVEEVESAKLYPEDRLRLVGLITSAFEQSAVNNLRLFNLFLVRNELTLEADERMPTLPVKTALLTRFFQRWILYMPKSVFDMIRDLVLIEVDPPASVVRATNAARANSKLVNTNAGQHWLEQFDRSSSFGTGLEQTITAMRHPPVPIESKPGDQEGVYIQDLHELILTAVERLIRRGQNDRIFELVARLTRGRFDTDDTFTRYQTMCLPVVRDIISVIEAFRQTRDAAAPTTPTPLVLPNTFRIKTMVLPLPRGKEYDVDQYRAFLSAVAGLLDHLSSRHLPYHEDFSLVVDATTIGVMRTHLARLALQLVRLDEVLEETEPSLGAYLRMELVAEFLAVAADPGKEVAGKVVELLESWKGCRAEGLRRLALRVDEKLGSSTRVWLSEARKGT